MLPIEGKMLSISPSIEMENLFGKSNIGSQKKACIVFKAATKSNIWITGSYHWMLDRKTILLLHISMGTAFLTKLATLHSLDAHISKGQQAL